MLLLTTKRIVNLVAKDKLTAEWGSSETKIILRWPFNFGTLTVTPPEHKHIAWLQEIQLMIQMHKTTTKLMESTIGCMGHVSFMIPGVYHFLSHLRSLLACSWNRRMITIDDKCTNNLVLIQLILDKAQRGIDMNLLAFRSPERIYYLNSCPAGLGCYSDQGHAWQFKVPDNQETNNLFEFWAAVIMLGSTSSIAD